MRLIEAFFNALVDGLIWLFDQLINLILPKPPPVYPAKFEKSTKLLKTRHYGFNLTGKRQLSLSESFRNALVIGATGTGKTSTILLPSLYSMVGSFVVHDPSGELYQKSAGYLKTKGYNIKVLNFSDIASAGFNPIKRAVTSADMNKVASLLIRTSLGSADQFWNQQAITLLSILIHLVKTQDPLYQNLAGVRYFLTVLRVNPDELNKYVKRIPHNHIYLEYQAFLNLEEKVKAGVVATCLSALQLMLDSTVARVTAFDSLNFEAIRKTKTAIFISNPVSEQKYYSTITSIFIEQLLGHLMFKLPGKADLPVFLLIDEASSLYLPGLSITIANVRKYKTGILLALQDFNQLIHVYGKEQAETIKANCYAKVYFTGQPLNTAIELEQSLGLAPRSDVVRPLITRDELRTMPLNQALLLIGNHQPMKVKLKPYYKNYQFKKLSQLPALRKMNEVPPLSLPKLNLPVSYDQPILPKRNT